MFWFQKKIAEKAYYIRKAGKGGQAGLRKKKASVGLFSTFRHPLATKCTVYTTTKL